MALTANSSTVNINELSAFTEKGIHDHRRCFTNTATSDPYQPEWTRCAGDILQHWGWPELPLTGDGNNSAYRRWRYSGQCPAETYG